MAKNAYIPYLYARKCIAKIMGDMTDMKTTHVRIVCDIQDQYKQIEDETQVAITLSIHTALEL